DLGDEIKKPKHIKQAEQGVRHSLQRLIVAKPSKHLASENGQQKKKQDSNFEVIGMCRTNLGEVIKTAGEQDRAANHSGDLEILQALVIQHPIKFQQSDHSEDTN